MVVHACGYRPHMASASEPMCRDQRLILAIAVLASFVSFLDGTVVNVALPDIMRELGGELATQQWVVDAYLVTLGALILVAGSLSDAYGRIRILRLGVIGFGVASIAIAAAPTPELLVAACAVQGIAGALLVPSSLALITANFRDAAQARAIGIWTAMTTGAMVAGPLIGGLFSGFVSWRFAFLINVLPIAAVLVPLVVLGHDDVRRERDTIDWLCAVLCTVGLGGPVFALIEQPNLGSGNPAIHLSMGVGLLAFAGFLVRQRVAAQPMMPLSLFRVRNFWTGNIATAFICGAPSARYGPRLFMTVGPLIMGAGSLLLLSVSKDFSYWWQVLPYVLVFGVGLTLTVTPLTSAILGSIERERSGMASAVNNAVSRVAGLLVIAMLATIIGGLLDLTGFDRGAVVTAVMMLVGAVVSFAGIRNHLVSPVRAGTRLRLGLDLDYPQPCPLDP